jgi:phage pi2 protein 07
MYDRKPTPPLMEGYFMVLEEMSDDEFKESITTMLKDRKYQALPKPAEILEYSRPDIKSIATLALQDVERAFARGGRNMSLVFDDKVVHSVIDAMGGWVYLCDMEGREWEFKRKEFARLYKVHSKRTQHPDHVAGYTEKTSNMAIGQGGNFARVESSYVPQRVKPVAALNPPSERPAIAMVGDLVKQKTVGNVD